MSDLMVRDIRWEDAQILVSGPFMDALSGLIDGLDPVISAIERMAEWFANASKPVQQFITTTLLLVPVISAIGVAFGGLIALVGTVVAGMTGASFVFGSLGAAVLVEVFKHRDHESNYGRDSHDYT
jgi:hypothetical protein